MVEIIIFIYFRKGVLRYAEENEIQKADSDVFVMWSDFSDCFADDSAGNGGAEVKYLYWDKKFCVLNPMIGSVTNQEKIMFTSLNKK